MAEQNLYLPDQTAGTIKDIDFARLARAGINCVALDVDSTLVRPGAVEIDQATIDYLNQQQQDGNIHKICIASNRLRRNLEPLAASIGAELFYPHKGTRKPKKRYFDRLLRSLNCRPEQAVMIGDKVVRDIFGANRAGMSTILVDPLGPDLLWDRLVLRRWRDRRLLKRQ